MAPVGGETRPWRPVNPGSGLPVRIVGGEVLRQDLGLRRLERGRQLPLGLESPTPEGAAGRVPGVVGQGSRGGTSPPTIPNRQPGTPRIPRAPQPGFTANWSHTVSTCATSPFTATIGGRNDARQPRDGEAGHRAFHSRRSSSWAPRRQRHGDGLNDNASGTAALIELAHSYAPTAAAQASRCRTRSSSSRPTARATARSERALRRVSPAGHANILAVVNLDSIARPRRGLGSSSAPVRPARPRRARRDAPGGARAARQRRTRAAERPAAARRASASPSTLRAGAVREPGRSPR